MKLPRIVNIIGGEFNAYSLMLLHYLLYGCKSL